MARTERCPQPHRPACAFALEGSARARLRPMKQRPTTLEAQCIGGPHVLSPNSSKARRGEALIPQGLQGELLYGAVARINLSPIRRGPHALRPNIPRPAGDCAIRGSGPQPPKPYRSAARIGLRPMTHRHAPTHALHKNGPHFFKPYAETARMCPRLMWKRPARVYALWIDGPHGLVPEPRIGHDLSSSLALHRA